MAASEVRVVPSPRTADRSGRSAPSIRWMAKAMFIAGLAVVIAAGCRSSGGGDDDEKSAGLSVSAIDPIPGIDRSETDTPISGADALFIRQTVFKLTNRCMEEQGFDRMGLGEDLGVADAPLFRTPSELRANGYGYDFVTVHHENIIIHEGNLPDPFEGLSPARAEAHEVALFGNPDDPRISLNQADGESGTSSTGCMSEARAQIYGSVRNSLRYEAPDQATRIDAVSKQLNRDEAYVRAVDDWQVCMEAAGIGDVEDREYGYRLLITRADRRIATGEDITPAEIDAVAQADADCQEQTGLDTIRAANLTQAREQAIEAHGVTLNEWNGFQQAVLTNAKHLT